MSDPSTPKSHGWVTPLPSGAVARCGGPGMCSHCQLELRVQELGQALASVIFERDQLVSVLADLLAAVDVVTLADPTHFEVATAVALPALIARQLIERYRRDGAQRNHG